MLIKPLVGKISILVAATGSMLVAACNSSSEVEFETYSYSSTAVTGFSLEANKNILDNLDSIFFSIDLNRAQIFNASPLPVGTRINRLIVNLTTDNCSTVELTYKTDHGNDTIVDYLNNATDSINFANGPVRLHVVSYDLVASRDYTITVNVFKENPDSMVWIRHSATLPSLSTIVESQKTSTVSDKLFILTYGDNGYSLSSTDDPYYNDEWSKPYAVNFVGFTPKIESFTGTGDGTLYIISEDNVLYRSIDEGATWSSTEKVLNNIYGVYENSIMGGYVEDGKIYTVLYPANAIPMKMDIDFPVSGTSNLVSTTSPWQVNPQAFMIGGKKLSGELTDATWGFDGEKWAKLNVNSPGAVEEATIFPYTLAYTDTVTWRAITKPVIMMMGGRTAEGTAQGEVYYTNDLGLHWTKAPDLLQFTSDFPLLYGSQAHRVNHILTPNSRAIAPITEWECPFIYLFGGYSDTGRFNNSIWQGVIDRFTMIPLQ